MSRKYDFVLFGASGFTGKYALKECFTPAVVKQHFKWAIAGRNREKLEECLNSCVADLPEVGLLKPDFLVADIENTDSLLSMAESTTVVVNLVGPYRKYGKPMIEACIKASTHLVDLCGETEVLERMHVELHEEAVKTGSVIVQACGFDSIPSDYGCALARNAFAPSGVATNVQIFLSFLPGSKGYSIHYGTFESAVLSVGNQHELQALRTEKKNPVTLKTVGKKPPLVKGPASDPRIPNRTYFLFPGADASVIRHTQEKITIDKPDAISHHTECYLTTESGFFNTTKLVMGGALFMGMAKFKAGRNSLLNYPKFWTNGYFSHEGPTQEQIETTTFSAKIFATGYSSTELVEQGAEKDKRVCVEIKGPDPGYVGTSKMILTAAFALIKDQKTVTRGGVFTPGFIFGNSEFFNAQIQEMGIVIDVKVEGLPA